MLRYSFLADSMTMKGLLHFARMPFTVVVLPLPVIPQTKVCLARSLSLSANFIEGTGLLPTATWPIAMPPSPDETIG